MQIFYFKTYCIIIFAGYFSHSLQITPVHRPLLRGLSDVNAGLSYVKLAHPENKPVQLSEMMLKSNGHITGSAIQVKRAHYRLRYPEVGVVLVFARVVGTYVPEEDKVWEVYLNSRDVCDLLLSSC